MAEAKARDEWSRMSSLMALTANIHRGKNKRAYKPDDFDPFVQQRPRKADMQYIKRRYFKGARQ